MNDFDTGQVQGAGPLDVETSSSGPNPAWNDVLSVLPEQFHSVVTPHFQKWDNAAQSRVEAANAKVKEFEAYAPFLEHGINANEIEDGLRLLYEVNADPKRFMDALGKAFGLTDEQKAEVAEGVADSTAPSQQQNLVDPRFDQLQGNLDLVNKILLEQHQKQQESIADAELDAELQDLKNKHGDYNERYVLAMMDSGMSGEEAVQSFMEMKNSLLQNNPRPFAPSILGSNSGGGSGLPSQAIDPTQLSGKETRNLVAQMLAAEFGPKR